MDVFQAPAYLDDFWDVNFSDDEEDVELYFGAAAPLQRVPAAPTSDWEHSCTCMIYVARTNIHNLVNQTISVQVQCDYCFQDLRLRCSYFVNIFYVC